MHMLTVCTHSPMHSFTLASKVAALLACDPKKGITKDALFKGYTEMGMGDIAKDLALASDPKTRKKAQILAVAKEGTRLNAEQLSMIFDQYDPEKELTKAEFRALWGNLGFQEEFMQTYFTTLDTDENGLISFKELLAGLAFRKVGYADVFRHVCIRTRHVNGGRK